MIRWYFLSMEFHVYWLLKSSCFELSGDGKYSIFSRQKVDGKMMLTDYSNVLVLNHSVIGNTVFSGPKSDGKMISIDYWKGIVLNFSEIENMVFFEPKSCWKDDIYLFLLSHPRYSRAWEIWFFCAVFDYSGFSSNIHFLHGLLSSLTPWGGPMVDRKARTFEIFICRFLKFHGSFEEKLQL